MKTLTRSEIIEFLVKRDGYKCMFPGCVIEFDNDRHILTIDHIYPQSRAKEDGWSFERIWDLENLQLLGKSCNSRKSNLLPLEDGSYPVPVRVPRVPRQQRVQVCDTCYSGRLLLAGEICDLCGSGPQPATAPRYLQVAIKDCDHDLNYCAYCYIGLLPRKSALESLIIG